MTPPRRRGHPRGKRMRQSRALDAMAALSAILEAPHQRHPEVVDAAARDAFSLVRRHKVALPESIRPWLCRGCHALLQPSYNARVRIHRGFVVVSCLICDRVRRRPLGPEDGGRR